MLPWIDAAWALFPVYGTLPDHSPLRAVSCPETGKARPDGEATEKVPFPASV